MRTPHRYSTGRINCENSIIMATFAGIFGFFLLIVSFLPGASHILFFIGSCLLSMCFGTLLGNILITRKVDPVEKAELLRVKQLEQQVITYIEIGYPLNMARDKVNQELRKELQEYEDQE